MSNKIPTLISEKQIQERIDELAKKINKDYKDGVTVICILKGSIIFTADLVRKLTVPTYIEFMVVSSYEDTESTGNIKVVKDLDSSIANKDVLIVEDIVDTGRTLKYLMELLNSRHPRSLKICTLLSKKARRNCEIDVAYYGFDIEDEFVIGYGLDYNQEYRNLPYIGILNK